MVRQLLILRGLKRKSLPAVLLLIVVMVTCVQPSFGKTWVWVKLSGSTLDRPGLTWHYETGYGYWIDIIVRGKDNGIYLSTYDIQFWVQGSWTLLGGSTPSGPAITNDASEPPNYYYAVRGMNDGIYWRRPGLGWWLKLSGSTPSGPAISLDSNYLYVMVRGKDNGIYWCRVSRTNPYTQGPWQKLTGATIDSPSFFESGGYMWIVVRGTDNGIYWCYVNTETFAQASWHKLTGSTESSPAISYGDSGDFYVAARGSGNIIYYALVRIADNYHNWNTIPGKTPSGPAIDGEVGMLFFCVRGTDSGIYFTW